MGIRKGIRKGEAMGWPPKQEKWGLDPNEFNTRPKVKCPPAPHRYPWSSRGEYVAILEMLSRYFVHTMRNKNVRNDIGRNKGVKQLD